MPGTVNQSGLSKVYNWLAGLRQRPDVQRAFGRVWPSSCLVCGGACEQPRRGPGGSGPEPVLDGLCAPCARALPWNRRACERCALPLPDGETGSNCGRCLRRPPPLDACHAAFVYGFPLDRLLPRAKFHDDLAAGHRLGGWMAAALAPALVTGGRPDAVVPVPLHRDRLRRRGYDQALELARPLAGRLGLPLHDGLLRRVRATRPQSRLDAAGRRRNLRAAFAVEAAAILPAHVALVDDVMTTGATLHAAALALRRAGVARVDAWVCARVP
ncbi:ComF family protein [Marilutibacter chinensis]